MHALFLTKKLLFTQPQAAEMSQNVRLIIENLGQDKVKRKVKSDFWNQSMPWDLVYVLCPWQENLIFKSKNWGGRTGGCPNESLLRKEAKPVPSNDFSDIHPPLSKSRQIKARWNRKIQIIYEISLGDCDTHTRPPDHYYGGPRKPSWKFLEFWLMRNSFSCTF